MVLYCTVPYMPEDSTRLEATDETREEPHDMCKARSTVQYSTVQYCTVQYGVQ